MRIIFFSLILSLYGCFASPVQQKKFVQQPSLQQEEISESKAVVFAEKFIADNGYTKISVADKSKIVLESLEWQSDVDKMLENRHDTLQEKAYGILRGRKAGVKGWTIIFRYTNKKQRKNGRAVTMNLDGTNLRVEHQDIFLKPAEKKFE